MSAAPHQTGWTRGVTVRSYRADPSSAALRSTTWTSRSGRESSAVSASSTLRSGKLTRAGRNTDSERPESETSSVATTAVVSDVGPSSTSTPRWVKSRPASAARSPGNSVTVVRSCWVEPATPIKRSANPTWPRRIDHLTPLPATSPTTSDPSTAPTPADTARAKPVAAPPRAPSPRPPTAPSAGHHRRVAPSANDVAASAKMANGARTDA